MIHELKILPKYFQKVISKEKKFEIRKFDRDFHVGDMLILKEYDEKGYTGAQCICKITYILEGGEYGLEKGYCVLSIDTKTIASVDISSETDITKINYKYSELGLFLQNLRKENGETLTDMANKLKMNPNLLLYIEGAKTRAIPVDFDDLIIKKYNLSLKEAYILRKLIRIQEIGGLY